MTTAVRRVRQSVPAEAFDHGDPKRYRRGCRCDLCKAGVSADTLRWKYLRSVGRSGIVPIDRARRHVANLRAAGMPDKDIMKLAEISPEVLRRVIANGAKLRYTTELRILAVPAPSQPGRTMRRVDSVGTRRRLRALIALGWTRKAIAARIPGMYAEYLARLVHSESPVTTWMAGRIEQGYRELAGLQPEAHGVAPREAKRSRREAAENLWAPPGAWDDDRLDDPNVAPEWTGHCGTDRGWWMHRKQDIPVCTACHQAHEQWKQERRHLPRSEYMALVAASRASAFCRGAVIAQNARELLADGATYEQAANRLKVSTQHLFQELRRYPASTEELEAAA
ncbi:hypothetical protein [Streptomyces sp. OR43]|uniref:hypothetical protein n=1 Tax=Streptomyces sp. or43 TaxID=2478957 RepID=UPI0011CE0CD1|nr:hypothetical protein [Streptomyces sp. or43]TXS44917.1 hypothetical protein EAO72_07790 [Streptomyces sp. or43]